MKCRSCGLEHPGTQQCSVARRLAELAGTAAPATQIKTIVGDPSEPVLSQKAKKQAITGNVSGNALKQSIGVSGNAKRQAALKSRRAGNGLMRVEIWTHPDDMAAIKDYAKGLADKR